MKDKILKFEKKEFYSICDQLSRKDRGLHSILLKHGYPPFWSRKPNFETLVHIILEQQVSLASARAALVKLKNKIGSVTARKILLLSDIENLTVETQTKPKVVINERTGVIVMGGNITIEEVAVSRSGLNLSVTDKNRRRNWLGKEQEPTKSSFLIEESTSVGDVVEALNKVGASTKDIIAILEALKKSGALHAELEIQ